MIRLECRTDEVAVDAILRRAFPQPWEANLVARLRREATDTLSLVNEREGVITGHIFFSPVTILTQGRTSVATGLAPVAVAPELQHAGIGSALVRAGLECCASRGDQLVFVLGHADFYPRFGFQLAAPLGLHYEKDGFEGVFFVRELSDRAAHGVRGRVRYHAAFEDR